MPRQRSSVISKRGAPGAAGSKGCGALGHPAMRQRAKVAGVAAERAAVTSSPGVRCVCAARASRRAGVKATPSTQPMTTAAAPEPRLSSMAQRVSAALPLSTNRTRAGSIPSAARPGPYSPPASRAARADQHHTNAPGTAEPVLRRRAASSNAKVSAAGPSPKVAGLISLRLALSRRRSGSQPSISGAPNVQRELQSSSATAHSLALSRTTPIPRRPRSRAARLARNRANSPCRPRWGGDSALWGAWGISCGGGGAGGGTKEGATAPPPGFRERKRLLVHVLALLSASLRTAKIRVVKDWGERGDRAALSTGTLFETD